MFELSAGNSHMRVNCDAQKHGFRTDGDWQLTHARELRPVDAKQIEIVQTWQLTHARELRRQKPPKIAIIFDV